MKDFLTDEEMFELENKESGSPDFISDEDMSKIENSSKSGILDLLTTKAPQGVSLNLSDELAGISGAAGFISGSPDLSFKDVLSPGNKREQILDIYRQAREQERMRQKKVSKDFPIGSFATELVAGGLIPGSAALKGAKTLKDATIASAKVGAGAGAISGFGASESEDPSTLGKDVAIGATAGVTAGAALPSAAALASGTGKLLKGLGSSLIETPIVRDPLTAGKAGLQGRLISTETGRRELDKGLENISGKLLDDVKKIKGNLSKEYTKLFNDLEQNNVKIESKEVLEGALQELQTLKNNPKTDKKSVQEITELEDLFSTYLKGREEVIGYRPKAEAPKELDIDKKRQQILEQLAKVRQTSGDAQTVAEETVKKRAAEKLVSARNRQAAMAKEAGSDDINYIPEAVKTESPVPEFSQPTVVRDETTGKNVIQMVDEKSGETIAKAIDEISPGQLRVTTDEATGVQMFKFTDPGTGKTYVKPFKEEKAPLSTDIEPIIGRRGVDTKLTPLEAKETVNRLKDLIDADQFKQYDTKKVVVDIKNKLNEQVKQIEPLKELDENFKNFNEALENLNIDLVKNSDNENIKKLVKLFSNIEKSGNSAFSSIEKVFPILETKYPGITQKYRPQLEKIAKEIKVNTQSTRPIYGRSIQAAAYTGYATKKVADSISNVGKDLVSATPEQIKSTINYLYSNGSKAATELATILGKLEDKDVRKKQALIFAVMQNPEYRELLGINKENDEQPEQDSDQ